MDKTALKRNREKDSEKQREREMRETEEERNVMVGLIADRVLMDN